MITASVSLLDDLKRSALLSRAAIFSSLAMLLSFSDLISLTSSLTKLEMFNDHAMRSLLVCELFPLPSFGSLSPSRNPMSIIRRFENI
ncbi:hypothetical protein BpHYR1_037052 [Brachionus plicatilis]|uniref:Uncharacterized protein n=1 Tax=Brachionus plicatilis TaxID=10195 RepID=A0A3M7SMP9_BRAPC|nr:hypothetical protein BpHYR1_037052 [Brachionus plicatilis]